MSTMNFTGSTFLIVILGYFSLVGTNNFKEVVFTSPVRIRKLLYVESRIIDAIDNYIKAEESRIEAIQNFTETWSTKHNARMENKLNFLSNPVNSFHLIKSMAQDWETIIEKANDTSSRETFLQVKNELQPMMPSREDMRGIMDVLINMRNVYQYGVHDLAKGVFGPFATNVTLSFQECFSLSKRSFEILDYNNAIDWAQAALLQVFENTHMAVEDDLIKLFQILAEANVMKGDYVTAMNCFSGYLQFRPDDQNMQKLKSKVEQKLMLDTGDKEEQKTEQKIKKLCNENWWQSNRSNLRCKYNFENSPFLRLAPLKEELRSKNPKIVLFYDVLYNSETDFLINYVVSQKYKESTQQQSNKVNDDLDSSDEIKRLRQRTRDITSLHTNFMLRSKISSHGYRDIKEETSDLQPSDSLERRTFGQRIATVSYFFGDVYRGGATVFPHIDLIVPPIRGSALLWFNTDANRDEDIRVRHISCPVVLGYKWVLTNWISEKKIPLH